MIDSTRRPLESRVIIGVRLGVAGIARQCGDDMQRVLA